MFFFVSDSAKVLMRQSLSSGWLSKKFSIAFNSSDISSASAAVFDEDFLNFFSSRSSQSDSWATRVLNSPYSVNRSGVLKILLFHVGEGITYSLDILFLSNHNIHKSSHGLCFWASDPLIDKFYKNLSIKGSEAQKQRLHELL